MWTEGPEMSLPEMKMTRSWTRRARLIRQTKNEEKAMTSSRVSEEGLMGARNQQEKGNSFRRTNKTCRPSLENEEKKTCLVTATLCLHGKPIKTLKDIFQPLSYGWYCFPNLHPGSQLLDPKPLRTDSNQVNKSGCSVLLVKLL